MKKYMAAWKADNPKYFDCGSSPALAKKRSDGARIWRRKNPGYQDDYRNGRRERYNQYMKFYMRRRRRPDSVLDERKTSCAHPSDGVFPRSSEASHGCQLTGTARGAINGAHGLPARTVIKEMEILSDFLTKKNMRPSAQRSAILAHFISTEGHLTPEMLHGRMKEKNPGIGLATIYRALKLFARCGLASEVRLGDKRTYFEHAYRHPHHDHLVCCRCQRVSEFSDPTIEKLQRDIARRHGFAIDGHSLKLYGLCGECR